MSILSAKYNTEFKRVEVKTQGIRYMLKTEEATQLVNEIQNAIAEGLQERGENGT